MKKQEVLDYIFENKIITIARGIDPQQMVGTAKALYDGGIRLLEITFNQNSPTCVEDTMESIRQVTKAMGDKMCVGAGTVMTDKQVISAYAAGAKFILSPNVNERVITLANEKGMVTIPGALTPTEISDAYNMGADIVKLFPAGNFGLEYIKAVMAPINHIPMMAVGGIDENNIADFLSIGLKGVGIGSNIVKNSFIQKGNFEAITELALKYTQKIK